MYDVYLINDSNSEPSLAHLMAVSWREIVSSLRSCCTKSKSAYYLFQTNKLSLGSEFYYIQLLKSRHLTNAKRSHVTGLAILYMLFFFMAAYPLISLYTLYRGCSGHNPFIHHEKEMLCGVLQ